MPLAVHFETTNVLSDFLEQFMADAVTKTAPVALPIQ
jgi:hypothetical protein